MQHALSTRLFSDEPLGVNTLEQIQAAGIPLIEVYGEPRHLDVRNRTQISELGKWFLSSPLKVHSMHAPVRDRTGGVITITEPVRSVRKEMVDHLRRAMEVAETVPCRFWVQHMGVEGDAFTSRAVDAAYESLVELQKFARHRGMEVLLENIPAGLIEKDFTGCERLVEFAARTKLELKFCFDTGHAHMEEGVVEGFERVKERIGMVHVHDNNGREDAHELPFSGVVDGIDWGRVMDLLRTQGERYPVLLEPRALPELESSLDEVRRVFDQLDEAKESEQAKEARLLREAREMEIRDGKKDEERGSRQ